ncbi:MAG: hypothetical protein A3C35_05010 [Omnitrophica bacterium RIFCSPHIGHO2_02_FULL_46_11]|nr:MAG: hypothetical protein A3C35_05010 [Omnitrophica bacterium RIFCSPHIGHO2_02_FULL_46_11]OGW87794.1 MAG: hypothetical protein A3A81_01705 [Omnitrophica bacterium RIFCSPLOWO2_01_FULL_45_10b]
MKRKLIVGCLMFSILLTPLAFAGYQDTNRFAYGLRRVFLAPFRIPFNTLRGTVYGPPITGTLQGVVVGAAQTVTDLAGGTFDMAAAAAPYAKYAIFFV